MKENIKVITVCEKEDNGLLASIKIEKSGELEIISHEDVKVIVD